MVTFEVVTFRPFFISHSPAHKNRARDHNLKLKIPYYLYSFQWLELHKKNKKRVYEISKSIGKIWPKLLLNTLKTFVKFIQT